MFTSAALLGLLSSIAGVVVAQGTPPAWLTGAITEDGTCGPNTPNNWVCTPTWGACCGPDGRCGRKDAFCGEGCQPLYGNCNAPPWTGVPSPDGTCGGTNLYNCTGSAFGACCSANGRCGDTPQHCGTGCQDLFGKCPASNVTTDGQCGSNGKVCTGGPFGECCSAGGWCGSTTDHCGAGCQPGFGTCSAPSDVSSDGQCGSVNGKTCAGSAFGNCCSAGGWCGSSADHCGAGCQAAFGTGCTSGSGSVSTDGECGSRNGKTCKNSGFGDCCSPSGYCGSTGDHCGAGCQSGFGTCSSGSGSISTDGRCGSNGKTCTGSTFGTCCSSTGYCGSTADHCAAGCQSKFGTCSSGSGNISTDGKCGSNGKTCVGSGFGNCCSSTGNCGSTAIHCGQGCQKSFSSSCLTSNIPSVDGTCGPSKGGWTCNGGDFNNQCCSAGGYCGTTSAHCGSGCKVHGAHKTDTASQSEPVDSQASAGGLRERHKTGSSSADHRDVAGSEPTLESKATKPPGELHAQVAAAQISDILSVLLMFRFINALCVRTFFQPDEYFQALEPAWDMAFGSQSGAWLTWEWHHQLRSSLHPAIFAVAYKAVDGAMAAMSLYPPFRAFILVALPGALQSLFAALGDFYTWKLAMDIYGRGSNAPWAALWMTVLNPWQWYCSTRTFSNSLETTLTIAALSYWPWELLADAEARKEPVQLQKSRVKSLRISLVLAAIAVLLRPTNLLIWLVVLGVTLSKLTSAGRLSQTMPTLIVLLREIILCGLAVLAVSLVSDRLYFGFWTFPPYKWLYFNISQSLAVFYGHMPWHYYLSQGVPLLTTTFLPFALVGLYKATASSKSELPSLKSNTLQTLAAAALTMITTLSLISHKEVRFIYPLLPILHILAAPYISSFFTQPAAAPPTTSSPPQNRKVILRRTITLTNLLSLNLLLAGYLSLYHQPAPLSVLTFLRSEFERLHPDALELGTTTTNTISTNPAEGQGTLELFALFLTPCHSTPWRSHLVYPSLRARALTCEPPLHTSPGSKERAEYLDEADRFYLLRELEGGGEGGWGRLVVWDTGVYADPSRDGVERGEEKGAGGP
ncbi:hypothetical protein VTJ49DRAFT_3933 [Mycothermus thermophilus]|uniref:Mannosyltransferase n=1 Tax=Humicola insolens TaxID=85995 RepID=A0ABR3V8J5_HUMIN